MADYSFHIRTASVDDAPLLAELSVRTFYEAYATSNDADNLAQVVASTFDPEKQARELANQSTHWFIAEATGEAIGYAMLRKGEKPESVSGTRAIQLARIYVLSSWHGRGVGAALMQACLNEAASQGYDTIWLGVWEHNPRAIAFYQKWGFVQVGAHAFQFGKEMQTDLLLQRAVSPSLV